MANSANLELVLCSNISAYSSNISVVTHRVFLPSSNDSYKSW